MAINVFPKTIYEACELLTVFYKGQLDAILSYENEEEFCSSAHYNEGLFIRSAWNLWWDITWRKKKPNLVSFFNNLDIYHADDMSSIILTTFYLTLKGEPIELQKQVDKHLKYWNDENKKYRNN